MVEGFNLSRFMHVSAWHSPVRPVEVGHRVRPELPLLLLGLQDAINLLGLARKRLNRKINVIYYKKIFQDRFDQSAFDNSFAVKTLFATGTTVPKY
jgi:hypothetical protein